MRERVTLTIASDLLRVVDLSVDGHNIKNRSHAIELLLLKAFRTETPTRALILAGGKNTTLKSVIGNTPHVLAPIQKRPVIEHVIDLFKKFGITDIIVSLHHDGPIIKKYLENANLGVKLTILEERFPMGTSGPLSLAREHLTSTFFVANADELKNIDLHDMFIFHREHRGLATVALTTVDDPTRYGVANLNGNSIVDFTEKPKKQNAPSNLINAGLYLFEPEVLEYVPEGFGRLEVDVFPKLAKESKLKGYAFSGQWFDIDSEEQYSNANKRWKPLN